MFQNVMADQIYGPVPADSALTFAAGVLAPTFETAAAATPFRARYVGFLTPTFVAADWYGIGVGVANPDLRGRMVLSYSISLRLAGAVNNISAFVLDRQAAVGLAAGVNVAVAPAVDLAWSLPPVQVSLLSCCGRQMVDTEITSATPGVLVREFFAGFTFNAPAGANRMFVDIAVELFNEQRAFFQPGK